MENNPVAIIDALHRSHERLESVVRNLDADDLRARSYCSEWSIAQVLSHIGSGSEIFQLYFDAGLSGEGPPEQSVLEKVWDAWNARTPDRQAEDALTGSAALLASYAAASDDDLRRFHLSMWGMEIDAPTIMRMRLAENAIHTWDVEVVHEPAATVAQDAAALVVDQLPGTIGYTGKPQGKPMRLHVMTTDPARDFYLAVGDRVRLDDWSDQAVEGELRLPAEALYRLVYGRLDPEHTPGSVKVTAPDISLDDLRAVFPGV